MRHSSSRASLTAPRCMLRFAIALLGPQLLSRFPCRSLRALAFRSCRDNFGAALASPSLPLRCGSERTCWACQKLR
eukprot:5937315-Pyramimonas_sp.AAC.1